MTPCKIPFKYAKAGNPNNSLFDDFLILHPSGDFTTQGTRVWTGSAIFGRYTVSINQKHPQAEVFDKDITILSRDPKEEDYIISTSNGDIAESFNKYIYNLYR